MFRPGPVLVGAAVAAALVGARPAPGKDVDAGCASLSPLAERLRSTLLLAAVHRTRGSSMAAYQVLLTNARNFTKDSAAGACGVLPVVIDRALDRAAHSDTALAASLELDLGFAAAVSLTLTGQMPPNETATKLLDVGESVEYGDACPDLFRVAQRLIGPPEALAGRVSSVLADLKRKPRCARVRTLLESTAADGLAHAVDSIALDESDTAKEKNPISRCPELPIVLDRLSNTIALGAPLFNRGDHAGCRRLYMGAAHALAEDIIPVGRCPHVRAELTTAVLEASRSATDADAAWAMRRGFDRIAGVAQTRGKPANETE